MTIKLVKPDSDTFLLRDLPATIGRAPESAVHISDRWLSRRHCEIYQFEKAVVVRDLGSTHGTYVNGEKVSEVELRPGDRISVGLSTFVAQFA
jgi:adenylate cyclase